MENVKTPTAKRAVGNKTTELIIGTAANKLASAVVAINAAVTAASILDEKVSDGALKVVDLEDKIGGLQQDLKNKIAQNQIDLQQQYDADKQTFVDRWLNTESKIAIGREEFSTLQNELGNIKANFEGNVAKEVAKANAIANNQKVAELKMAELTYQTKEANNLAEMNQLKNQVSFLESQVAMWKGALDAERNAGIERAKASSIGTLNVGQPQR